VARRRHGGLALQARQPPAHPRRRRRNPDVNLDIGAAPCTVQAWGADGTRQRAATAARAWQVRHAGRRRAAAGRAPHRRGARQRLDRSAPA
jgi:hypothetical protein